MSDEFGTIEDGFGSVWPKCKADCELVVVRPGKVQCDPCDTKEGDEHVARAIADGACPDCSGSGTAIFHAPGRHDWRYRPPVARQRDEDDA